MANEGDRFSSKNQLNSRRDGSYWQIASEVENGECVFCNLRDKYIVTENEFGTLTVNIFHYIDGQMLIIPRRHLESYHELNDKEVLGLHKLTRRGVDLLKENLGIDNIWIILREGNIAGKTIKHLHLNIIPYEEGLHTWNYDSVTLNLKPIELAVKLRQAIFNERT